MLPDYVYCGTSAQVGPDKTVALLQGHGMIWCPPPRLRPWNVLTAPVGGERIWLCWSTQPHGALTLLGAGRLTAGPKLTFGSAVLWTSGAARADALRLGYSGPTNMSFLKLTQVQTCVPTPVAGVTVNSGLSELGPAHAQVFSTLLPL